MAKKTIWKTKPEETGPRPPLNYFSRRVQTRLLILVASLMLVVLLFSWAANPDNWKRWFGPGALAAGEDPLTEQELSDEPIDTALPRMGSEKETPLGTITAARPPLTLEPLANDKEGINKATNTAWQKFLEQVSVDDRRLLSKLLYSYRQDQPLSPDEQAQWVEVVGQLATRWDNYLTQVEGDVNADPDLAMEDRSRWVVVLHQLRKAWVEAEQPALLAAVEPATMDAKQRGDLERLQQRFDQLAMEAVRDDTIHRPAEIDAWFRLMEILQQTPAEELTAASKGRVGFQQLYKQSDTYRGELVTVRGTVVFAYHVLAPENIPGVDGYYIFWLIPTGGPESPIVIYALECPDDFPIVPGGTPFDEANMQEPVELTGYYFKRWAYSAADDIRVAPLLLAKSITWNPVLPEEAIVLPQLWMAILATAMVALLAVGISVLVYKKSQAVPSAEKYAPGARVRAEQWNSLQEEAVTSPAESLRKLAGKEETPGE